MKLLFDENLSPKLVRLLHDLFPDSLHIRDVALKAANDPVGLEVCPGQLSDHLLERFRYASA
jgi:predicted nuclease of predicted toxin-antitoxin system